MKRRHAMMVLGAITCFAGCEKTGEGEYQVKTPDVDVKVPTDTSTIRVPDVDVGTKIDTVNVPTIGTRKDTVVVDRPVVGSRQSEVRRPTAETKRP